MGKVIKSCEKVEKRKEKEGSPGFEPVSQKSHFPTQPIFKSFLSKKASKLSPIQKKKHNTLPDNAPHTNNAIKVRFTSECSS